MFSGKTTKLLQSYTNSKHQVRVLVKPAIDHRYGEQLVATHDGLSEVATVLPVEDTTELRKLVRGSSVGIFVDEAQFFRPPFFKELFDLARHHTGCDVFIAGLDMDYLGFPFGEMPLALARAEVVVKLFSSCSVCHKPAHYTQRKSNEAGTILVGGTQEYAAKCLEHWKKV
jgi:thymidine kinase